MKNKYLLLGLGLLLLPFIVGCGEGDEFQAQHNQGKNCLECHGFTSGATIYKSINGANYDANNAAQGYTLQLMLESGKILKYSNGNGYGNRLYNGDQGAINNFTPQVIDANGTVVNQSANNSHNVGRLACNRCHTQDGLNGAPGRIVNYDYFHTLSKAIQNRKDR
jgi:hypothetical protein